MKPYLKTLLFSLFILLMTSCSDSKPDKLVSSFSNDLEGKTIFPANRVSDIKVYANYDDGTRQDVTNTLLWSSSDESIAIVENGKVTTFSNNGNFSLTYETVEESSESVPFYEETLYLEVKDLDLIKIELSPSNVQLSIGESKSVTATGTFEDTLSSQTWEWDITEDCNWSSADSNISSVDKGSIKGIQEGNTTITASDLNITSNAVVVEVKKTHYSSISIHSLKTSFNVEQTITLEVRATTDQNTTVVLNSGDNITWQSSDSTVIEMDNNIATAVAKGEAIITANFTDNGSTLTDTITLTVEKDKYIRLFKGDKEVDFPYVDANISSSNFPGTLDTFTIRAVGEDITIRTLYVQDFDGEQITSTNAVFDNLSEGDTINADDNRTYNLKQYNDQTNLNFFFDIDTENSFKQTYKKSD